MSDLNIGKKIEQSVRRSIRRRQLMRHGLSKNLGAAFLVTGGIGDLVVVARFVRDLLAQTGGGEFAIFYSNPSIAYDIFSKIPGFKNAYPHRFFHYGKDLFSYALKIHQLIEIEKWPEFSPSFSSSVEQSRLIRLLEHVDKKSRPLSTLIQHHPYLDGELGRYAAIKGRKRHDFLHHLAGLDYGGNALDIIADAKAPTHFGLAQKKYITIHNGFDENMSSAAGTRATKVYPFWGAVIERILPELSGRYELVQIGTVKTSEYIPSIKHNLIGQTTIKQAFGLLRETSLHLDNEGGFVHVAASFGKRSAVVFGPTPPEYFAYDENLNIGPLRCGGCWWLEKTWMEHCPRDQVVPVCMNEQPAEEVASRILTWIQNS